MSRALETAGVGDGYRLIGGVAVMLHIQHMGLDLPIRSTGDADYGIPPVILSEGNLVKEIERLGYARGHASNQWERQLDGGRVASVDLLIPAYTSRAKVNKRIGDVVTTEVPGLAEALLRPSIAVDARFRLSDESRTDARVLLPDAASMLLLKAGARRVRDEDKDASDLWRCLEIAAASGITEDTFMADNDLVQIRPQLSSELARGGRSLPHITRDLSRDAAGQLETRIQALLRRVAGI